MTNQATEQAIDLILGLYQRDIERHHGGRTVGKTYNQTEAKAALKQLVIRERIDELGKYQDWLNSEGRLWSERKLFYEDRVAALEAQLIKKEDS